MTNLQLLAIETDARKRAKYSTVPDFAIPRSKFTDQTTSGLTTAIIQKITLDGGFVTRTNTMGVVREGKYTTSSTVKGWPDITGIMRFQLTGNPVVPIGFFIGVEVKCAATKDRISDAQKKVGESIRNAGGIYIIATTYDQFLQEYEQYKKGVV